ncbi:nickel pincer cofactor biosynthesis protein LarC [Verrucomicrobiota bacterium]
MKVLRFDSVGGASGDMILASFIDLGINAKTLQEKLYSLSIEKFDLQITPFAEHDFNGTQVSVNVPESDNLSRRTLKDIRKLIEESDLSQTVKTMAIDIFERLAEAEAKVHNTTPDKIHFHEVGAIDSIVDIVGCCIALEMLEVDKTEAGPLPIGKGTTKCAHGVLPLPVPATAKLLKGHPIEQTDEPFELVTPTGAAVLMTWTNKTSAFSLQPSVLSRTGYGFGHRKLNNRPNMLRAMILETELRSPSVAKAMAGRQVSSLSPLACLILECNIDDTIPELIGSLSSKLIKKGALDVFTSPVQMKKQRPGTLLTVLCKPEDRETFIDMIFSESTTFGIREYTTHRTILERRHEEVETPYGKVRIKIGSWKGKDITHAPEHDDCVKCAEKHGVSVRKVYESAHV